MFLFPEKYSKLCHAMSHSQKNPHQSQTHNGRLIGEPGHTKRGLEKILPTRIKYDTGPKKGNTNRKMRTLFSISRLKDTEMQRDNAMAKVKSLQIDVDTGKKEFDRLEKKFADLERKTSQHVKENRQLNLFIKRVAPGHKK